MSPPVTAPMLHTAWRRLTIGRRACASTPTATTFIATSWTPSATPASTCAATNQPIADGAARAARSAAIANPPMTVVRPAPNRAISGGAARVPAMPPNASATNATPNPPTVVPNLAASAGVAASHTVAATPFTKNAAPTRRTVGTWISGRELSVVTARRVGVAREHGCGRGRRAPGGTAMIDYESLERAVGHNWYQLDPDCRGPGADGCAPDDVEWADAKLSDARCAGRHPRRAERRHRRRAPAPARALRPLGERGRRDRPPSGDARLEARDVGVRLRLGIRGRRPRGEGAPRQVWRSRPRTTSSRRPTPGSCAARA